SLAGIVAAETNNGTGIAGVGYKGVKVMPITVLGADGLGRDSDIIEGLVWAADHGADVALMAFSANSYSTALQAAVDYAWSKGVVLVAATGNDGSSVAAFPAGDAGVVGVSSTDQNDALAASSNYGTDTFLGAPGVGIPTLSVGGGVTSVSGTSAAAAHVAAAAALLRAHDSALANGVVVERLARTADAAGTANQTGNGRLNLARALGDTSTGSVKPEGTAGDGGPFVGPYVTAVITGALEGQSCLLPCTGTGTGTWIGGNLANWRELDQIPLRVSLSNSKSQVDTQVVTVSFDHTKTTGGVATPGVQNLFGPFVPSAGITITSAPALTSSSGDVWTYSFTVSMRANVSGAVTFTARMAAGAHNFSGSSLSLSSSPGGTLQISKPAAAPGNPDLALSKTGTATAIAGATVTYTISYQNKSGSTATGVQLTDTLPGSVTYVLNSCTPACTSVSGGVAIWDLGSLAVGATGSVSLQATVNAGTTNGSSLTDSASIRSAENDANANDNTATFSTLVSGNPSISGTVYNDTNGNGSFDSGELGISGVTITRNGTSSGTSTSDASGNYSFVNLTAGTYSVDYSLPAGYANTGTKPISGITLASGQTATGKNFFATQNNASLAGKVYNDANGNGSFDVGEVGLSGVTVSRTGTSSGSTPTAADGSYTFTGLAAGTYSVDYTVPTGYANSGTKPLSGIAVGAGAAVTGKNFFARRATSTSVSLTTGTNPSTYGTPVTFTATVTSAAGNPSSLGTVTFFDGATAICTGVALTGNTATCSISSLAV
nr:S8 family serine peptidase [Actinomycetota bacterium]